MTFTDTQKKALDAPLDPKFVRPPPQGKYGEYIEGVHVFYEANRIFGFDGWSSALQEVRLTNEEHAGDKHRVGYLAVVNVTAGGQTRCGIGHGQGFGKSLGDAHDSAVKEAETDAIKRAMRTFGNPFGLALYDKSKANVQAPAPELVSEEQRQELSTLFSNYGLDVPAFCKRKNIKSLKEVPAASYDALVVWLHEQHAKKKENA